MSSPEQLLDALLTLLEEEFILINFFWFWLSFNFDRFWGHFVLVALCGGHVKVGSLY